MDDLRIFLTTPDPGDPLWWGALAVGLVTLAGLWDLALPRVSAFVASTATKIDDRILAAVRPLGRLLRVVAAAIRFVLPLARVQTAPAPPPASPGPYRDAYDDDDVTPDHRGSAAMRVGLALCLLLTGCGAKPWETAQTTTSAVAHVVQVADAAAALAYTERAQAALEAADSLEDYRERMGRLDAVEVALRTAHHVLLAAQAGVLAWQAGDAGDSWRATMPCLATAVHEVVAALAAAGVPIPPEIQQGVDVLAGFLGSRCTEVTP